MRYFCTVVLVSPTSPYDANPKPPIHHSYPMLGHDDDHTAVRDVHLLGLFVTLGFRLFRS